LLIGSGAVADRVAEMTTRHGEGRLEIVGQVACGRWSLNPNLPQLGEISDVPTVLERHRIDRALVAFTSEPDSELVETLRCCVARGVQVDVIPPFYDLVGPTPRAFSLGRMALVEVPARGLNMSQRITKRAFDMFGSATLVLLFSPLLVVTAAATLLLDGPPIFFRQSRQGRGGRVFTLVKFRTMRPGAEQAVLVAAENARADVGSLFDAQKVRSTASITRLGRVLRRSSVDELPQLWNVFRGDMSLVGPRPLALYEADHLEGWHRARQDLRPGLTGLWQVSGRSDVGWQERMHLDYTYVSHWSLVSDLRILLRTVPAVFRGDGAI
jgi:exopolysaccharide biosynthesis polyprenyl glycosylphosphotransferase